jgi:hypothetical protein
MLIIKDDYFIKVSGNHRKYFHFENILSITAIASKYQGKTYDEALKEFTVESGDSRGFWSSFLESTIVFKPIFNNEIDELRYDATPEAIAEWNSDFKKLTEAHAKYHRNKK